MKVVILAGGLGTRLAEETEIRPKPLVEIGGKPILWHIMKHYGLAGFNEFFIALGYKGRMIRDYFLDYHAMVHDVTVKTRTGEVVVGDGDCEDWTVHLVDTGQGTMTGGRVKRLQRFLANDTFMVTYGDGVSTIDLHELLAYHRSQNRIATISAVRPPARFGGLHFAEGTDEIAFIEKAHTDEGWINGGFMVFEPEIFNFLESDDAVLEVDLLERLAAETELAAYKHAGFWQCMDTLRDVRLLQSLWDGGDPPWRLWENGPIS